MTSPPLSQRGRRPPATSASGTTAEISRRPVRAGASAAATASSKSSRWYTRTPSSSSSRQKNRCRLTSRAAAGGCATRPAGRAPRARRPLCATPAAAPDTSNATSAPAPPVHPRRTAATSVAAGRRRAARAPPATARRCGVQLDEQHLGARGAGDAGDQQADRSATDHDRMLAGAQPRPADVVHRDRRGLHQRAVVAATVRPEARTSTCGRHRPGCCIAPGESIPMKFSRWQMCVVPGAAGRARAAPRAAASRSPARRPPSRSRPSPTPGDPAGHLVADHRRPVTRCVHVAVQDVQVGAADAGVGHVDLDLAGPGGTGGDP